VGEADDAEYRHAVSCRALIRISKGCLES